MLILNSPCKASPNVAVRWALALAFVLLYTLTHDATAQDWSLFHSTVRDNTERPTLRGNSQKHLGKLVAGARSSRANRAAATAASAAAAAAAEPPSAGAAGSAIWRPSQSALPASPGRPQISCSSCTQNRVALRITGSVSCKGQGQGYRTCTCTVAHAAPCYCQCSLLYSLWRCMTLYREASLSCLEPTPVLQCQTP